MRSLLLSDSGLKYLAVIYSGNFSAYVLDNVDSEYVRTSFIFALKDLL